MIQWLLWLVECYELNIQLLGSYEYSNVWLTPKTKQTKYQHMSMDNIKIFSINWVFENSTSSSTLFKKQQQRKQAWTFCVNPLDSTPCELQLALSWGHLRECHFLIWSRLLLVIQVIDSSGNATPFVFGCTLQFTVKTILIV